MITKATLGLRRPNNTHNSMPNDRLLQSYSSFSSLNTFAFLWDFSVFGSQLKSLLFPVIQHIMNLLDQLFQYSLKSDSSSISFSALDDENTLELSSTAYFSLSQSSKPFLSPERASSLGQSVAINWVSNFEDSMQSQEQRESFLSYKDRYRRLSKLTQMIDNKIRKLHYEFIVKLENHYKESIEVIVGNQKLYYSATCSTSPLQSLQERASMFLHKLNVFVCRKMVELKRVSLLKIEKRTVHNQKMDYLTCTFTSIVSSYNQLLAKEAFIRMRSNRKDTKQMMVNYSFAQKLTLSSKKPSFRLETNIETTNFSTSTHHVKTPIIYPQGMEIENPDISDTINMFLSYKQLPSPNSFLPCYQRSEEEVLHTSIIRDLSENEFKMELITKSDLQRKSVLTNFTGSASRAEDICAIKAFTEYEELEESPQFALLPDNQTKEEEESNAKVSKHLTSRQEVNYRGQAYRFSLQSHQDEMNSYIMLRKSIQKKRTFTLKAIETSKQTIKKIVYDLQKSKNKPPKQKIKLTAKKSQENTYDKRTSKVQTKPNSPVRPQSTGNRSVRAQSAKKDAFKDVQMTIRSRESPSEKHLNENLNQFQSISKNLQIYSNYIKAKRGSLKNSDVSSKKPPIAKPEIGFAKKANTGFHQVAQSNLLQISKEPVLKERRIDLRIQFCRPSASGRSAIESEKGPVRRGKK